MKLSVLDPLHPKGYCGGWHEPNASEVEAHGLNPTWAARTLDRRRVRIDRYHKKPHKTVAEADACRRMFLLDERLNLRGVSYGEVMPCAAPNCAETTLHGANIPGFGEWALCDAHCTRETVAGLLP